MLLVQLLRRRHCEFQSFGEEGEEAGIWGDEVCWECKDAIVAGGTQSFLVSRRRGGVTLVTSLCFADPHLQNLEDELVNSEEGLICHLRGV